MAFAKPISITPSNIAIVVFGVTCGLFAWYFVFPLIEANPAYATTIQNHVLLWTIGKISIATNISYGSVIGLTTLIHKMQRGKTRAL